jgi:hypothetical protein
MQKIISIRLFNIFYGYIINIYTDFIIIINRTLFFFFFFSFLKYVQN